MKLVAGIDRLDLASLFAASQERIILHAAIYGAFARSRDHRKGLETALSNPRFQRLDIIALDPEAPGGWFGPFVEALRFGVGEQEVADEFDLSRRFVAGLVSTHPDKVRHHPARTPPCLPVIIADDVVIFGQYAHASAHAPLGFWGMVRADVATLMQWTARGRPPAHATGEEIAAFRLVDECVRAMRRASGTPPPHNNDRRSCPAHGRP